MSNEDNIIEIVSSILQRAISLDASDIHLNPLKDMLEVKFRIDGLLCHYDFLKKNLEPEVISRLKILSGLKIDEHRRPQDGRFKFQDVDVRISIILSCHGERVVLRLLHNGHKSFALNELGFSESSEKRIKNGLLNHSGLILCTGPTGSGKTSTLYSLLQILSSETKSIVTLEDPVEYLFNDIIQIQVSSSGNGGLSFVSGLRSVLRQDPNIIMVGEIRDEETARIAVNAALTGHLVLSTLHTNDATSAIPRLLDMGIPAYLLGATLRLVIAQRLVREVCQDCNTSAGGCDVCLHTGFSGRTSINEVLLFDDELLEIIHRQCPLSNLRQAAERKGMVGMKEDGLAKVNNGVTTLGEVIKAVHD